MFRKRSCSCALTFERPSLCQKHLGKFTDVNYMIQRAISGDTSVFRHSFSADVSEVPDDMQSLLNAACRGKEAFDSLPDEVRAFYPTVDAFLSALSNPDEKERLTKLGIFKAPEVVEPVSVRVIPEGNEPSKGDAHA